jgi:hypothetical protein
MLIRRAPKRRLYLFLPLGELLDLLKPSDETTVLEGSIQLSWLPEDVVGRSLQRVIGDHGSWSRFCLSVDVSNLRKVTAQAHPRDRARRPLRAT